jgi:Protein of unknown function (DUF3489)
MNVITAAAPRKEEHNMITNIEETETAQTPAAPEQPKAAKKAAGAKPARNVAPGKAESGKKATPAKKAPKAAKEKGVREGSKTETILGLLKRPEGASAKELLKITGWQAHSLRGFISGTLGKKMGLSVTSTKGENRERTYSVKA